MSARQYDSDKSCEMSEKFQRLGEIWDGRAWYYLGQQPCGPSRRGINTLRAVNVTFSSIPTGLANHPFFPQPPSLAIPRGTKSAAIRAPSVAPMTPACLTPSPTSGARYTAYEVRQISKTEEVALILIRSCTN